jgi:hypothetical protein
MFGTALGSSLITIPPPPQQQATPTQGMGGAGLGNAFLGMGSQQPVQHVTPPVGQATPPLRPPVIGGQPFQAPPAAADPLAVLDSLTVALETIKPGGCFYLVHTYQLNIDTMLHP